MFYFGLRAAIVISVLIFVILQQFSTKSMGLGSIFGAAALLLVEVARWKLTKDRKLP